MEYSFDLDSDKYSDTSGMTNLKDFRSNLSIFVEKIDEIVILSL
jgi:hypothetical protein